jgi:hypothetical protein
MQPRSLKRCLAVGLAACAIAPAAAGAAQPLQGQAVGAGGGPGLTAKDVTVQNLTAPDQVDRGTSAKPAPTEPKWPAVPGGVTVAQHAVPAQSAPTWPTHPRSLHAVHSVSAAQPSDDGGLDTGVWIALGTAALAVAGGIGLVGGKRLRTGRQRQLA